MRCADHALEYRKLADIKPYQKNPRKNDKAVTAVANSIREYGFQSPIIVDRDGVIIAGHTRYKAAKRLRLSTVPVIVAAELTPEQAKELRIADNSTNEGAEWDLPVLSAELAQLTFDPAKFGLPVDLLTPVQPEEPEPEAEEDSLERDRPYKAERSWQNTQISVFDSASPYGIPAMAPVEPVPDGIVWEGFNYALTETVPAGKGLHFFLDDYQFERVWASPDRYLDLLSRFDYVIAPDFSQYGDWPGALNLYNHYRKMWCAAYWQECGIRVVPYVIYRGGSGSMGAGRDPLQRADLHVKRQRYEQEAPGQSAAGRGGARFGHPAPQSAAVVWHSAGMAPGGVRRAADPYPALQCKH